MSEPREVSPFSWSQPGIDEADFRPRVADASSPEVDAGPKGEYAPGLASFSDLIPDPSGQVQDESELSAPAATGSGRLKAPEIGKPTS